MLTTKENGANPVQQAAERGCLREDPRGTDGEREGDEEPWLPPRVTVLKRGCVSMSLNL